MLSTLSRQLCGSGLPALSGNIYCVGRNYADHARELQNEVPTEPVIFIKAPSALRPFAEGPLAFAHESFHHEIEIVLLIAQTVESPAAVSDRAVASVSLGIDLTRRGVQDELKKKSLPWTIAKSFAGAALLHPFAGSLALADLGSIDFSLEVEGELRQRGDSALMLFDFQRIMQYLCTLQPLTPGDLIYTGTPAGVGPLRRGNKLRMQSQTLGIDAVGHL